jgi:serine/threonine-protein kinase
MAIDDGRITAQANRLGEVLGAYFVAVEEGTAPCRQELLAQHPDLANELAEYFAEQDRLDRMMAPICHQPSSSSTALDGLSGSLPTIPRVILRDTELPAEDTRLVQPDSTEMPALADRPARLQLFGEIARGGMGAILKGRDADLGRELAVKVLLESNQGHPEVVRRFIEEAQIGGQLQHPGIVPVYELGAFADRRPYFAMKLVKGQTLASLLIERRVRCADLLCDADSDPERSAQRTLYEELPRFLSIFESICQTVAYAHARDVIHRDLKPSNVMVGAFGEVQVMDWGLAKVLPRGGAADESTPRDVHETTVTTVRSGSGSDASHPGSILGTPSYMAPEQARGELDQVDERADVFGLGAILCEILTGKPPFLGRDRKGVHERAARGDLGETEQRLETCGADAELVALCRSCLASDPPARPRNAGEVAARVTAHLTGVQDRLRQAELARVEAQTRAAEERKRRRITVALAASVLITAGVVGGSWAYLARLRERRAVDVDLAQREAEVLSDEALRAGDDLARWSVARNAAQSAARLAADARDAATRARLESLVQEVNEAAQAAENDQNLLANLVDIRSAKADFAGGSESDAAYAEAFREAGIALDLLTAAEVGTRVKARPAAVSLALAVALDDWASVRRIAHPEPASSWLRIVDAASADPDPLRVRLRKTWSKLDRRDQHEALRKLAQEADTANWPVQSLSLLANSLVASGDAHAAAGLLRGVVELHASDVWVNYDLGRVLESMYQLDEAIRFLTAARGSPGDRARPGPRTRRTRQR